MTPAGGIDLAAPWWLLALPLALLPLLRRRRDSLVYPSIAWLPDDPVGRAVAWLWRALAVLTLAATVLALAGPGRSGTEVPRTARGAELLLLLDRSSSMDETVHLNGVVDGRFSVTEPKSQIVRRLLAQFIDRRPNDRMAFMAFGTSPLPAMPFTQDRTAIQAALAATGIGRGLPDTQLGRGLLAAIAQFDGRPYAGSRVIVIVSDGGAELDAAMQARIRAGLARNKIALDWIYIRGGPNAPDLTTPAAAGGTYTSTEELSLHTFFGTLATPYHLYQTDSADALGAATAEIDRQQNLPLTTSVRVPRLDFSGRLYLAALLFGAGLLTCGALQLPSWRSPA